MYLATVGKEARPKATTPEKAASGNGFDCLGRIVELKRRAEKLTAGMSKMGVIGWLRGNETNEYGTTTTAIGTQPLYLNAILGKTVQNFVGVAVATRI